MLNNTIKSFIVAKNLSPSKFADEIGVQRSSISHILSGRNKPSLDIVQKIIRRYPEIGTDWLLEEPPAPEPVRQPVAASATNGNGSAGQPAPRDNAPIPPYVHHQEEPEPYEPDPVSSTAASVPSERQIIKVLVFYSDGTFGEFSPAGR